jgi:aryl sulfotransferase
MPTFNQGPEAGGETITWPVKIREMKTALFDSTRWNGFPFREGDVVVATWGKTGTTWVEQIVTQLLMDAPEGLRVGCGPWVDMRLQRLEEVLGELERMNHRRCLKTHLPLDALVFNPLARYIYVGRDARDVVWSAYNHQTSFTEEALDAFNNTPGRVGPPVTHPQFGVRDYYLQFLETGEMPGFCMAPFWSHVRSWWEVRHLPNVLLVHFDDLKKDAEAEARRAAKLLGVQLAEDRWPVLLEHCSFDYMRTEAATADVFSFLWRDGAQSFFHKGTNGRWKDVLTPEEIARCDEVAARELTPECARWLRAGETTPTALISAQGKP